MFHLVSYDMRSVHDKFHEFSMYRSADISLLYLFEFFTLEEQESRRISYMKDVVLYEGDFNQIYFIFL
jgi:hypothetical protein